MHDYSLVDQCINNENEATPDADQTFALELVLEVLSKPSQCSPELAPRSARCLLPT